ncbi:MAG: arylesterase [Gammaproteobacteria bacterium]
MKFILQFIRIILVTVSLIPILSQANEPTLLILGDSLSAAHGISLDSGWVNLLQKKIDDQHLAAKVINLSQSGDTTQDGLKKLPIGLKKHHPKWVIIELGGNDGLRGLNIKQTEKNLETLINMSQKNCSKVLLIGMTLPPNYGEVYITAFENIYTRLADKFDLPLVPFLLDKVALDPKLMQADGIHPTAEAQPIILETVWDKIKGEQFLK